MSERRKFLELEQEVNGREDKRKGGGEYEK